MVILPGHWLTACRRDISPLADLAVFFADLALTALLKSMTGG